MNFKQMLPNFATRRPRPAPGPLRSWSDDELAAERATLDQEVSGDERLVARLKPEYETAAAEAYAGGDFATVQGNAAGLREAQETLAAHRGVLAGLNTEIERRAAEAVIARAERKRKALEAAAAEHIEDTKAMDAMTVELARIFLKWDASGEAVFAALPQKDRTDFWPDLTRRDKRRLRLRHRLCGLTASANGALLPAEGILSPVMLAQEPDLVAYAAPLLDMIKHVVFNGDDQ